MAVRVPIFGAVGSGWYTRCQTPQWHGTSSSREETIKSGIKKRGRSVSVVGHVSGDPRRSHGDGVRGQFGGDAE